MAEAFHSWEQFRTPGPDIADSWRYTAALACPGEGEGGSEHGQRRLCGRAAQTVFGVRGGTKPGLGMVFNKPRAVPAGSGRYSGGFLKIIGL